MLRLLQRSSWVKWLCLCGLVVSLSGGAVLLSSTIHHVPRPSDLDHQQQLSRLARNDIHLDGGGDAIVAAARKVGTVPGAGKEEGKIVKESQSAEPATDAPPFSGLAYR